MDQKQENIKNLYALVGKNIDYSFSRGYFNAKFKEEQKTEHLYVNFDIATIKQLASKIQAHPNIKGLNVTIPYKQEVLPYLTSLDATAQKIGAVNTIKVTPNGLVGYNTDAHGFKASISPFLQKQHKKALILGTGGASKAVAYALESLGISYLLVSRAAKENQICYADITPELLQEYTVVINCTPLGTFPDVEKKPELPYQSITKAHLFYDLIYNPEKTAFLQAAEKNGAQICNGLNMLELQAEKAWEIWNK